MLRIITCILVAFCLFTLSLFFNPSHIWAETSYVLPYPSFMPGHKLYTISKIWDALMGYWSFGNLSQFIYHLKMSDKYLVEADILLRRGQYRLGFAALENSDKHFLNSALYLQSAKKQKKEVIKKEELYQSAADAHIELLNDLLAKLPETIHWQEENGYKNEYQVEIIIKTGINSRKIGVQFLQTKAKQ